jgi:hypothetical protein
MISDTHASGSTAGVAGVLAAGACVNKLKKEKAGVGVGVTYSDNGK